MPTRSKLAQLLQAGIFLQTLLSSLWLVSLWHQSAVLALAGFALILASHSLFLAVEFLALWLLATRGLTLPAAPGEILRAWCKETLEALRTFYWRQPFRSRAQPDQLTHRKDGCGRRGVVLVHGFLCNRGFWNPWIRRLRESDHCFIAVNLEPVFGSIDQYGDTIDCAIRKVTSITGHPPVLIGHSMGGLAARAWLRARQDLACVDHVVTIAAPHQGTRIAQFSVVRNGRQMRIGSEWLAQLGEDESLMLRQLFTCWYSNCDNVVQPTQHATLPGADNRHVSGCAHVDLAFHAEVMDRTFEIIQRPCATEDLITQK